MRGFLVLAGLVGCSEWDLNAIGDDPEELVAELIADPEALSYGVVTDGDVRAEVVTLLSVGTLPVTISAMEIADSEAFTLTNPLGETTLQPGESTEVLITYSPETLLDQGFLVVKNDGVEPKLAVPLTGESEYAALEADPSPAYLHSYAGEEVEEDVRVTSIGTTDLHIDGMVVQADQFTVEADLPVVLRPGESTVLHVTYYPIEPGETVTGRVWLDTNTAASSELVPLEGHQDPLCVGLGEAWDDGDVSATLGQFSRFKVTNGSATTDICQDAWYVWLSDGSQDLGAGDMNGDMGDDYPFGSLGIGHGDSLSFKSAGDSGASWYCMEQTQYTSGAKSYSFTGARVPEPLLSYMLDGDQDGSWAWQLDNPVMIAGRGTNLVDLSTAGGTASVTLRVFNMGGMAGSVEIREPVPAGYSASGFSRTPSFTEAGEDGDTIYGFNVSLDARTETDLNSPTHYDEVEITYTLTVPACEGRTYVTPMETRWTDGDGYARTGTANPLTIRCE